MSSGSIKINDEDLDVFGDDINENEDHFGMNESGGASDSPIKFIPPHEMMANSKKDFNVGTAHSVAVWERGRRKFI